MTEAPAHTLTSEQEHILHLVSNSSANLMIQALAGTGKTSTIELAIRAKAKTPVLYLAFNRRIVDEAKTRLPTTTTIKTFNSLGHGLWAATINKRQLTLNAGKCGDILRGMIDSIPQRERNTVWDVYHDVINAVARAKAVGYVPDDLFPSAKHLCSKAAFIASLEEDPDDLTLALVDEVLSRSIKMAYAGTIDFNDQIYMPALFSHGGVFPKFPLVTVDEYQDLSPVDHHLLMRLTKHSRLIGVGDPNQNIYGFRGAKARGMESAILEYSMTVCPLTLSFRCPSAIVANALWHVPAFRAFTSGGSVTEVPLLDPATIPENATVLCRNNAPLFAFALKLLASGRSVSVTGTDIGPRLIAIMKRLGDADMSQGAMLEAISIWLEDKLERNSSTAQDLADCMRVFARQAPSLSGALAYAQHLFAAQGTIRCLTIHKSKGLEWPCVYFLDAHLCGPTDQDRNLRYVAQTRSSDRLLMINSDAVAWPEHKEAAE